MPRMPISISLDVDILPEIDKLIKITGKKDRSDLIRSLIYDKIKNVDAEIDKQLSKVEEKRDYLLKIKEDNGFKNKAKQMELESSPKLKKLIQGAKRHFHDGELNSKTLESWLEDRQDELTALGITQADFIELAKTKWGG